MENNSNTISYTYEGILFNFILDEKLLNDMSVKFNYVDIDTTLLQHSIIPNYLVKREKIDRIINFVKRKLRVDISKELNNINIFSIYGLNNDNYILKIPNRYLKSHFIGKNVGFVFGCSDKKQSEIVFLKGIITLIFNDVLIKRKNKHIKLNDTNNKKIKKALIDYYSIYLYYNDYYGFELNDKIGNKKRLMRIIDMEHRNWMVTNRHEDCYGFYIHLCNNIRLLIDYLSVY